MHREVIRPLMLWPAVASVTITTAAWLAQVGIDLGGPINRSSAFFPILEMDEFLVQDSIDLAVPMSDRKPIPAEPAPTILAEVQPRTEHGSRAMQLPQRVAVAYGVERDQIIAPQVDEQQEMAGWVTPNEQIAFTTVDESSLNNSEAGSNVITIDAEESLTSAILQVTDTTSGNQANPANRPGISRSEPSFPSSLAVNGFDLAPPSLLPKSTRVLAKPALTQGDDSAQTKSVSVVANRADPDRATDRREGEIQSPEFEPLPAISDIEFSHPAEPTSPTDLPHSRGTENTEAAKGHSDSENQDTPSIKDEPKKPTVSPPQNGPAFAGWPRTAVLDQQLEALQVNGTKAAKQWARIVANILSELQARPRLADPEAGILIDRLNKLARSGSALAEQVTDRSQQIEWLLTCHAVVRRIAVWKPIWQLVQPNTIADHQTVQTDQLIQSPTSEQSNPQNPAAQPETAGTKLTFPNAVAADYRTNEAANIKAAVTQLRKDANETGDRIAWCEFLLLDEIEQAAQHANSRDRVVLAQRVLSRLKWHGLDDAQERWLDRESVEQLTSVIRPWARGAVDYANLLRQLERQEADAIDLTAIEIANSVQSLRFATSPDVAMIGKQIDTYYRNANIRIALSETMLQRMMPTMEPQKRALRTVILDSNVRGSSQLESELRLRLHPSPNRWHFDLQANGKVRTNSTGYKSGVAVNTYGTSQFQASSPIEIDRKGIDVGLTRVSVRGRSNLRSIRTEYDGWPVVGSLVQSIAKRRFEASQSQLNRIANQKIKAEVSQEFEQRVDEQINLASSQLSEMVLGPLGRLQLNPKVMDLKTTDKRLLARYRLAGDWQLAAFTPRPRAPSSSLMSLQIHQSALNNTFEQLIPRDQPLTLQELVRHSAVTFGQDDITLPADIPSDVSVQFAKTRPVTVEIENGQLWITLRVLRLRRGDRKGLTQFIVRAAYSPQVDGAKAFLTRDGHLRISGPGMSARERLPIRAVFNKVLSPSRTLPLTLPRMVEHPAMDGLEVSQLELRDGWIAMAISERGAYKIALRGSKQSNRD